jgi:redox-sensitive bicupin YhaK (pirin superfamily)
MTSLARRPSDAAALKQFAYVDPAETCLPVQDLAAAASPAAPTRGRHRQVVRVPSLRRGGFITNLLGARDIRGRGSHSDAVPHADPFILVHFIETATRIKPPFCAHPHMGTEVATVLLRGEEIWPWDNLHGFERRKLHAGGVYLCSTGRGVVHDESQQPPFTTRKVMRASFDPAQEGGLCSAADGDVRSQFLQVWWNAGYIHDEGASPLPTCSTQVASPAEIPLRVLPGGLAVRVLIGELPAQQGGGGGGGGGGSGGGEGVADGGVASVRSPVKQRGSSHVLMLHACVAPGADATLRVPPDMNGFLFVCDPDGGRVVVGGGADATPPPAQPDDNWYAGDVEGHLMAKLPPGGTDLRLQNPSIEQPCELLIFLGVPVRKPYCKYVGYGGAMVHASRDLVEEAMTVYEQDPKNFGRDDSAAQIDWSKFYLVPGFQNRDGPGLEREDGVMARFAETAELGATGTGGGGGGKYVRSQ